MKTPPTPDKLAQEARFRAQLAPGLAEVKQRLRAYFDDQEARCEAMRATVEPSTVEWHLRGHQRARIAAFNALALCVRMEGRGWGGKAKEDAWGVLRDYLQSAIPGCGKRRLQAHHAQAWMDARLKPARATSARTPCYDLPAASPFLLLPRAMGEAGVGHPVPHAAKVFPSLHPKEPHHALPS